MMNLPCRTTELLKGSAIGVDWIGKCAPQKCIGIVTVREAPVSLLACLLYKVENYTEALKKRSAGLKIGRLKTSYVPTASSINAIVAKLDSQPGNTVHIEGQAPYVQCGRQGQNRAVLTCRNLWKDASEIFDVRTRMTIAIEEKIDKGRRYMSIVIPQLFVDADGAIEILMRFPPLITNTRDRLYERDPPISPEVS